MSTDLYGIRVLQLAPTECRVRFRVFVVYYDTGYHHHQPLTDEKSFFLRVLWDEGDIRFGGGGPIGEEISVDQILDEGFVDSNAYRFIERVEIVEERNTPVEDYSQFSDFYYERDGVWEDEEQLVQGDYDVYVTDAKYLEHLKVGMSWGTTSYPTCADLVSPDDAPHVPDLRLVAQTFTPFEGEREDATPHEVLFSADSRYLVVASEAGEIVVYLVADGKEYDRFHTEDLFPELFVDEPGPIVHVYLGSTRAIGWDAHKGEQTDMIRTPGRRHSPGGRWHVEYGDDENLFFLDEHGQEIDAINTGQETVEAVAFFRDEKRVMTAGMHNTVRIWDIESKKRLANYETGGKRVLSMSLSPDEEYLALCVQHQQDEAQILRLSDGAVVRALQTGDFLGPFAYSPDGRYFAMIHVGRSQGYGGKITLHKIGATWPGHNTKKRGE